MKAFLIATGKAVELSDLVPWLRLYFGLEISPKTGGKGSATQITLSVEAEEPETEEED